MKFNNPMSIGLAQVMCRFFKAVLRYELLLCLCCTQVVESLCTLRAIVDISPQRVATLTAVVDIVKSQRRPRSAFLPATPRWKYLGMLRRHLQAYQASLR